MFVLGIDTCGPSGSVALGRINGDSAETIRGAELAGRTYSATLVSAIREILAAEGILLGQVGCIVVVNGPGSFTGVRVGVAAAKGLAEGAAIPMVAVSRLEVLGVKAATPCGALDAHRCELFLRIADPYPRDLLTGAAELANLTPPPEIAVCDDAAAGLLQQYWPNAIQVPVAPPSAADAIALAAPVIAAGHFTDVSLLDGHYLRRSDAEIFGNTPGSPSAGVGRGGGKVLKS
jgi:tRNA threonylcarbamoyladenosine biosynthesis protein TsaB